MDIKTILTISIGLIVLIGGGIGGFMYYRVLKKRKAQKILAATATAAATTFVAAETIPTAPPAPAPSNVTISTVEEVHNAAPEKEIQDTTLNEQNEQTSVEKSPTVTSENDVYMTISPEITQEAENMISPPVEPVQPAPETPATPLNETLPTNKEEEASPVLVENPIPETPVIEKPISDIFLTPATPPEPTVVTPIEKPIELSVQPLEAHPLFE